MITELSEDDVEELTAADIESAREQIEKEAYNPFSKENMKEFFDKALGEKESVMVSDIAIKSKYDLLAVLSATAYAKDNGFGIDVLDDYFTTGGMMIRDFKLYRKGK